MQQTQSPGAQEAGLRLLQSESGGVRSSAALGGGLWQSSLPGFGGLSYKMDTLPASEGCCRDYRNRLRERLGQSIVTFTYVVFFIVTQRKRQHILKDCYADWSLWWQVIIYSKMVTKIKSLEMGKIMEKGIKKYWFEYFTQESKNWTLVQCEY